LEKDNGPVPYTPIMAEWLAPPAGDNAHINVILDRMAEMERDVLGFLGVQYAWGSEPPDALNGRWPNILHFSGSGGALARPLFAGGDPGGHPGGKRIHQYNITIAVVVGVRSENTKALMAKTLFWFQAIDQAYAANNTLGGAAKYVKIRSGDWGTIEFGQEQYYGWLIDAMVEAQYMMRGSA
jgi:hypothetical protein